MSGKSVENVRKVRRRRSTSIQRRINIEISAFFIGRRKTVEKLICPLGYGRLREFRPSILHVGSTVQWLAEYSCDSYMVSQIKTAILHSQSSMKNGTRHRNTILRYVSDTLRLFVRWSMYTYRITVYSASFEHPTIGILALTLKWLKGGSKGPNLSFSRILLLSRAIFSPLFFVIVTLVIVRLWAKKISQLMHRFPAN